MKLIGCTIKELWIHLESQFKSGMTRDNYGEWSIDHIIPCNAFNLKYTNEQLRCFNWFNLQPLWKSENSSKYSKYKFNIDRELKLYYIIKQNE